MPTGQPDPRSRFLPERSDRFLPQERSDVGGGAPKGRRGSSSLSEETQQEYVESFDVVRGHAERLIQEAMEAGEFDDLPGTGEPIPGAGTVDDELWWVRSWLRRNQDQG